MNNNRAALGLIETYGLVGAIEGLDVALKSANVSLIGREFVKGGRVTIEITGDVSAVKAAVEAAGAAVEKLGTLITTHVIARSDDEIWAMLENTKDKKNEQTEDKIVHEETKVVALNKDAVETKDEEKDTVTEIEEEIVLDEQKITDANKEILAYSEDNTSEEVIEEKTREELEVMRVQELRTLARKMELTSLTKKQIKFSKKEQLIQAILEHWKRR
ncbi:carbon dioxide concentrating mechanism protein [Clostridiaceae bacterium 14S0207]|nr:carbon dioxide concentrating mechanism protein [Clostridiaceae bacterium 14S0207]